MVSVKRLSVKVSDNVKYEWSEKEGKIIVKETDEKYSLTATAFDIETYNPRGMPEGEKDPMVMISTYNGEGVVYCWKKIDLPFCRINTGGNSDPLYFFSA